MKGIPWRFSGAHGLYNREEIRLLMAFLRVVADPDESQSLYHLAASDLYRVPPLDLARCNAAARRMNRSLFQMFKELDGPGLDDLTGEGLATIQKLLEDILDSGGSRREPVPVPPGGQRPVPCSSSGSGTV